MSRVRLEPTAQAQWQALVAEAMRRNRTRLDEALESYLVFLLMHYAERPETLFGAVALDYLDASASEGRTRDTKLRTVGDKCLLLSGLFPGQAKRRRVRLGYFVEIGQTAYQQVAEDLDSGNGLLYRRLARAFVTLMDVLHAVRGVDAPPARPTPLESMERWHQTASPAARRELDEITDAVPVWDPNGGDTRQ